MIMGSEKSIFETCIQSLFKIMFVFETTFFLASKNIFCKGLKTILFFQSLLYLYQSKQL